MDNPLVEIPVAPQKAESRQTSAAAQVVVLAVVPTVIVDSAILPQSYLVQAESEVHSAFARVTNERVLFPFFAATGYTTGVVAVL
jgi:hypothetical protein